jgi:uncharacterized protein
VSRLSPPIRMCVGCGERAPQATLLRLHLAVDGALRLALPRGDGGRSAYLHGTSHCWEKFAKRKGPVRSLRCSVDRGVRAAFVSRLQDGKSLSSR